MSQGSSFGIGKTKDSTSVSEQVAPTRDRGLLDHHFAAAWTSAQQRVLRLVRAAAPRDYVPHSILEGEASFEYLVAYRARLLDAAQEISAYYYDESWLRLIRTLDPRSLIDLQIRGKDGDVTSLLRITENISTLSTDDTSDRARTPNSDDLRQVARLARLIALADAVDTLENKIRSSTKGVAFKLDAFLWPESIAPGNLRAALSEFDFRGRWMIIERWEAPLTTDALTAPSTFPPILMTYRYRDGFEYTEGWSGQMQNRRLTQDFHQFTCKVFTAAHPSYAELNATAIAAMSDPVQAASLVVFGNTLMKAVVEGDAKGEEVLQRGTMTTTLKKLTQDVNENLNSTQIADWVNANSLQLTAEQVIESVQALDHPGRRSFPGRTILLNDESCIVDLAAISWHVSVGLRLDSRVGGRAVNDPARKFELTAQQLLNNSKLAPPPKLLDLRGRELRHNQKAITDVDAIGVTGKDLFLISCKRYTPALEYLEGDYRSARNGQSKVKAALDDWERIISIFRRSPRGDNYDFSGYDIRGFILLPELIFTEDARSRELLEFDSGKRFFTRVEGIDQFAATLEMHAGQDGAGLLRSSS